MKNRIFFVSPTHYFKPNSGDRRAGILLIRHFHRASSWNFMISRQYSLCGLGENTSQTFLPKTFLCRRVFNIMMIFKNLIFFRPLNLKGGGLMIENVWNIATDWSFFVTVQVSNWKILRSMEQRFLLSNDLSKSFPQNMSNLCQETNSFPLMENYHTPCRPHVWSKSPRISRVWW